MAVSIGLNALIFIKIVIFIVGLFIFIPLFIEKPSSENIAQNILKGFCASIFSGIILTYCLVMTGLYDLLTLFILLIPVTVLIIYWVEGKRISFFIIRSRLVEFSLKMFDMIENKQFNIRVCIKKGINNLLVFIKNKFNQAESQKGRYRKIFAFMLMAVIVYCLYIRLAEVMTHTSLYYSDSYGHLMIIKQYLTGKIMGEKFYPLGYHSIIANIKMFSCTDFMDIIRFMGPIQTTILIASVYCLMSLITGNKYVSLLCSALLGMDSLDIWPLVFYRQIVALPQEFGTIFILPVVYFCIEYIINKKNADLKYFFICLANVFLIHFYVGMLLLWLVLGIFVSAIVYKLWTWRTFFKVVAAGLSSCAIGAIPFLLWAIVGWLFGLPNRQGEIVPDGGFLFRYVNLNVGLQDYLKFFYDALNPDKDIIKWLNPLSANLIIYSLIISFSYLILRGLFCKSFSKRVVYLSGLSIGQLFLALFYYGFKYNLIAIMYFERIGLALSICGIVITGILLTEFSNLLLSVIRKISHEKVVKIVSTMGISIVYLSIVTFAVMFPYESTKTEVYQYEGVLKAYKNIKSNCELLDWTIVSPVEELSVIYGYGFHYELWKFLEDFSIKDAKNRNFDFGKKLPSRNIFIVLEKDPLLVWFTIPPTVYQITETERYYRMYHGRNKLEKQLAKWMEEYKKSHFGRANDAKIFYEDQDIIVYRVIHEIKK